MYAPLKILMIASLKNRYSIILYEFLRDYKDSPHGIPKLEIEKFRNLMGVDKDKYKRFYDFKKMFLMSAVDEINEKTDLNCSYKLFTDSGINIAI
jgi:plasmid replication initiation protein